jgi:hypothetical protein
LSAGLLTYRKVFVKGSISGYCQACGASQRKLITRPSGTKTLRGENGVQTNVLVGKQDERKSKVSGDKKKVREDALLLTMQHDGIYLKHGKEIHYQGSPKKK